MVEEVVGESATPRIGDVMNDDPLLVSPAETLSDVAEKMRERDIGSALVTDRGRLIGVLTSRDMLRALAGRVHSSEAQVRQWMTAEPITVSVTTTLEAATLLMTEHHIHHLPVVEVERPVGIVGMRNLVRSGARIQTKIGLGF
jgi:CBS domain-containing protein